MSANDIGLLEVRDIHAHYGKSHVLHGVDLSVGANEVVSLVGRNGSGRSTTMKTIMGLVSPSSGRITLRGRELAGARPYAICRAGIAYVPEEREIFRNLSVDENLRMGEQRPVPGAHRWTIAEMFDYFPRLKERRNTKAGSLSGGEQQMLTMCRSLLGNPLVILIDEPTEGLAPKLVVQVAECIQDMHRKGVAVLLVEQKVGDALRFAQDAVLLDHGEVVLRARSEELIMKPQLLERY
ncbi:MAG: ABC transporter ATP-binding protein, partial [Achromobacter sp.]